MLPRPLSKSQALTSFALLHDLPGKHESRFTAEDTDIKKSLLTCLNRGGKKLSELTLVVINKNTVKEKNYLRHSDITVPLTFEVDIKLCLVTF